MKKNLLLTIMLFSLVAHAQTYIYHPFPDSNAVWDEDHSGAIPCAPFHEQFSMTFSGDTTINGFIYHKLFIPYVDSSATCTGYYTKPGYAGSIRQDTTAKKVFIIQPSDTTQYVLYDFNLTIGDLVPWVPTSHCGVDTITTIDSIMIGSSFRKRWLVGDTFFIDSYSIIEGVGATSYLIKPCVNKPDLPFWRLFCFKQNGMILYSNPEFGSCDSLQAIQNYFDKNISVTISPNPFHSTASFTINAERAELKVYNIFGELIKKEEINNHSTVINRNLLADGIYFYQLINGSGETATGKFVVE